MFGSPLEIARRADVPLVAGRSFPRSTGPEFRLFPLLNVNADVRNVVANSATFAHRHQ